MRYSKVRTKKMADASLTMDLVLELIGFEDLIPVFRENKVDVECLQNLTPELLLRELIPAVGPRIKYTQKLKQIQNGTILPEASNNSSKDKGTNIVFAMENDDEMVDDPNPVPKDLDLLLVDPQPGPSSLNEQTKPNERSCEETSNMTKRLAASRSDQELTNFDLDKYLSSDCGLEGQAILSYFQEYGVLNRGMRSTLVDLINLG